MDYEKKYKEALERAKKWHNAPNVDKIPTFANRVIEEIFPELKEQEEEKTRKEIVEFLKKNLHLDWAIWLEKQGSITKLSEEEQNKFAKGVLTSCAMSFIDYLDAHKYEGKMCVSNGECEDIENSFHNAMWDKIHRYYCKYIEKQGKQETLCDKYKKEQHSHSCQDITALGRCAVEHEQKPIDKIEQKFKVGDWVVSEVTGSVYQIKNCIENLSNHKYGYDLTNGGYISSNEVNYYHLWTIQDAKDGDVLTWDDTTCIVLFKNIKNTKCFVSYCFANNICFEIGTSHYIEGCHPATKKQSDTLFISMKEAGYEFDFVKKELKKI